MKTSGKKTEKGGEVAEVVVSAPTEAMETSLILLLLRILQLRLRPPFPQLHLQRAVQLTVVIVVVITRYWFSSDARSV